MILSSSIWLNATKIQVPVRTKGLLPVGNPQDGKIYIRGGYQSPLFNTMDVYDPLTDTIMSHPLPETLSTGVGTRDAVIPVQWYSAQWCEKRASILYFGGRPGNSISYTTNSILEYKPTTKNWRILSTTGPAPSEREDSCMTIDQENSKLVIFGGQDEDIVFGDIHVLDLITMEWTVGPLAIEGRIAMACAQHEDGFLAWGGAKDKFLMARHNTQPVVFNLTTMEWTTQYKMSSALISPTPDTSTGKNTTVFAVALGVTMFVVALIAIVIGVCLYRREKRKAVRNYSKANGKPGASILKEGSRSTLPSDLAIPNPLHQRYRDRITTGYGDGSRHDSEMEDYDEDISDQEDTGAHLSTDRKRRRRNKVSSIGHKIELSSMEPIARTSAVAGDKEEDLSFAAPSRIRPKAAPPIPHSQMPQTQASAPPLPT
ncbi:hypothetical protein BG011_006719 [Mortierella polycephala]|uniref:Galactose oxidase n=1 Tax=Mortierella polycephala TaxID=41804 RepID=A0A9P6PU67_9FUNG|nr:hypothetical protein BG011_006719 [Mortierella polycephala]